MRDSTSSRNPRILERKQSEVLRVRFKKAYVAGIAGLYLAIYNIFQALGWLLGLVLCVWSLRYGKFTKAYSESRRVINVCQLASFMEVIHALLGLVPSSPLTSLMQWTGRSHVLFAVVYCIEELQSSAAVTLLFFSWSLTEIIRYPQYALTSLGVCPGWLTWARYTVFIPLYPIGVLAEITLMYKALSFVNERSLHVIEMPNHLNFSFDYYRFLIGLLLIYPFLWWSLYSYMLSQRKKKVSRKKQA